MSKSSRRCGALPHDEKELRNQATFVLFANSRHFSAELSLLAELQILVAT